jgi:O-antigen/teichoic acid export membrane protein
MGVVRSESIKTSFFSAIGVAVGFLSQVFVFTHLLAPAIVGLIKVIQSFASLFSHFSTFNLSGITLRFFPFFRNKENGHNGFLLFIMIVATLGFLIFFILTVIFRDQILSIYIERSKLFTEHFTIVFPVIVGVSLIYLLGVYLRSLYKTVYATIAKDIYVKIFTLLSVVLYYFEIIDFDGFLICFAGAYALTSLLLIIYIISIGEFHIRLRLKAFNKQILKKISSYAAFGYLSQVVQISILEIDKLMIAAMVNLASTGIYGIVALFSTVLNLPRQAISNISGSFLAQAFKENNVKLIDDLYKKTSLNQLIIGSLIFMLIWFNIDDVLSFMPDSYAQGKYVVLILISMKLFDMATGINDGIINMSKYYKVIFLFNLIALVVAVGLNLLLIPRYNIIGAALATCFSIVLYNVLKLLFIYWRLKMLPFTRSYLKALLVFAFISVLAYFIPQFAFKLENSILVSFLNITVKSIIIFVLFTVLTLGFKVSYDVNDLYQSILIRIKAWFTK